MSMDNMGRYETIKWQESLDGIGFIGRLRMCLDFKMVAMGGLEPPTSAL